MYPVTAADYTGGAAAVKLSTILGINGCRWFEVYGEAIASSSSPARIGDSNVSTTRGIPIQQGGGWFSPPLSDPLAAGTYDLTSWYVYIASNDKVSVMALV